MYARIITVFVLIAFGMTAAMLVLTYPADAIVWVPCLLIVATAIFVAVRNPASSKAYRRPAPVSSDIFAVNEGADDFYDDCGALHDYVFNPEYSESPCNVFHDDGA